MCFKNYDSKVHRLNKRNDFYMVTVVTVFYTLLIINSKYRFK